MAQAVLNIVVSKLANIIEKEIEHLGGVGRKVQRVQRELIRIRCCLRDAASKIKGDVSVQHWLNELRDAAYRIEDAIDTFLGVDDQLKEDSSFLPKFKKLRRMPQDMCHHHKLGTELDNIENLLKEISESKVRYGIEDLQDIVGEAVRMPFRRATYQEVDETEVVGLQADKNNILQLLHHERTPRRAVITIVGAGGLGKTTLASMVYRSAKADFSYHIMLSISRQFSLTDLLNKMLSKYIDFVPKDRDVDYYAGEHNNFLSSERYLIILDDVWTNDVWNELKYILPNVKNGSRVLITSRFIEVATLANSQMPPYELNFLDEKESLDLLLQKALPYQESDEECPNDLLDLAHKLSKKCKGLPLALIVLGDIISSKEPSYPAWERVLKTMNWHSDGSGCMRVLAMSYEDMPYYLKACFQYLAFFPEDHVISAKRLIRMWIAEGFITLEGRPTIEIMAEDYVEELSKRSMIQVLSRSTNGLIKHFQVHDILRYLAMNEAGHENFVTVFSQVSAGKKPDGIIRRASLQAQEKNSQFIEYVGPNTRSLFLFDTDGYFQRSLHCSNFRLLKVLEIVGNIRDVIELKSLDKLIHLKYLGLRNCTTKRFSFHGMKSLETLELRETRYSKCNGLWTISTLKHVLVDYSSAIRELPKGTPISNLQTLKWVKFRDVCDAKLPNLRTLAIENYSGEWVSMNNLFQTLRNLRKLKIDCSGKIPMDIVYPKALSNYQNLQSLYLKGEWPENVNVEASLLPPQIIKLKLKGSRLNHNPMPEFGKLNSLKKLFLGKRVLTDNWEGPIICPKGFHALQYLKVMDDKDLTVAQGVMPKLTYLKAKSIISVHLPLELQHVAIERKSR